MAAPTLQDGGTLQAHNSGTTVTGTLGTHQADDILVVIYGHNTTGNTFTTPSGWTAHPTGRQDTGGEASHCFWKRATSSSETNPATTVSITMTSSIGGYARCYVIRGCVTSGDPFDNTAGNNGASTTPNPPSLTSTGADRLMFYGIYVGDDNTWSSGMPPTNYTQVGRLATTSGGDCMTDAIWRALASAGTEDPAAMTMSASDPWFHWAFAFKPPSGVSITPATETDTAQALSFTKQAISVTLTPAVETDTAQPLTFTQQAQSASITTAVETDVAQPLTFSQGGGDIFVDITPALETDLAQSLGFTQAAISKTLTEAVETDTAQSLGFTQASIQKSLTNASETDAAQTLGFTLGPAIQVGINHATESDAAQALSTTIQAISKTLTPATELDVAQALSVTFGPEEVITAIRKWYISRPGVY